MMFRDLANCYVGPSKCAECTWILRSAYRSGRFGRVPNLNDCLEMFSLVFVRSYTVLVRLSTGKLLENTICRDWCYRTVLYDSTSACSLPSSHVLLNSASLLQLSTSSIQPVVSDIFSCSTVHTTQGSAEPQAETRRIPGLQLSRALSMDLALHRRILDAD